LTEKQNNSQKLILTKESEGSEIRALTERARTSLFCVSFPLAIRAVEQEGKGSIAKRLLGKLRTVRVMIT
jgi:hypothetical protein